MFPRDVADGVAPIELFLDQQQTDRIDEASDCWRTHFEY